MLRKIYHELVAIRKELQAIRSSLEPNEIDTICFLLHRDSQQQHTEH